MIGASRRQRDDARDGALDLHVRLAGREALLRKVEAASIAALVASVAAWIAGAPLGWHAGAVAAAFVVGLARPVPDARERALGWIAEHAGLAYETALAARQGDPYGFGRAVEERARAAAARVRPPVRRPWWLAPLAIALGLLLLPAAQLVRPQVGTTAPSDAAGTVEPAAPDPAPEADPLVPPEDREDGARADDPAGEGADANDGAGSDGAPGASGDQETLSRFLDNLRERNPFEPVEEPSEDASDPPPAQPRDGEGERAPGEGRPEGAQQGASEEGREPGESAQGEGEQGEGEQEGQQGSPEEGQERGEDEGTPGPTAGDEAAPRDGEAPTEGSEQGADEGQLDPNAADGVGAAPSSVRANELEGVAEPQQAPEFLPGQLGQGPENPGGTVLLPGEDDVDVPPALRSESYRRAVEEAVTDGQVPLEYQEIIRNYFR